MDIRLRLMTIKITGWINWSLKKEKWGLKSRNWYLQKYNFASSLPPGFGDLVTSSRASWRPVSCGWSLWLLSLNESLSFSVLTSKRVMVMIFDVSEVFITTENREIVLYQLVAIKNRVILCQLHENKTICGCRFSPELFKTWIK